MEELPPAYDQKGMENHSGAGSSRPTVSAIVSVGSSHVLQGLAGRSSCSVAAALASARLAALLKVHHPIPAWATRSILGFIFWQFLG